MMNEEQFKYVLANIDLGLKILGQRALAFLAVIMSFGLYAWAVYDPNWIRVADASLFSFIVFYFVHKSGKE